MTNRILIIHIWTNLWTLLNNNTFLLQLHPGSYLAYWFLQSPQNGLSNFTFYHCPVLSADILASLLHASASGPVYSLYLLSQSVFQLSAWPVPSVILVWFRCYPTRESFLTCLYYKITLLLFSSSFFFILLHNSFQTLT